MGSLLQLQRDLREVEQALRLARQRWSHYLTLEEHTLASHTHRVVAGLEVLQTTLTARLTDYARLD